MNPVQVEYASIISLNELVMMLSMTANVNTVGFEECRQDGHTSNIEALLVKMRTLIPTPNHMLRKPILSLP